MGSACIIVVRACLFPVYISIDICWVYGAEVGGLIVDYIYGGWVWPGVSALELSICII